MASKIRTAPLSRARLRISVEPGKTADLVILTSDPSDDISALQQIEAVVKAGRIPRQEYDEPLAEE
ncbi:MAG: hypothetical protein KY459_03265 [Acidobacteria bacterium]|nr:hypothetical protein [Acidobacteriota bacterium]